LNREEFEEKSKKLLADCTPSNYTKIYQLLENATKLNKNELNCVARVSQEAKGAEEYNLEYLPKHFNTLNKGETVRMSPTKFAWIKESMILMQYAAQNSTRYMNSFTRLSKEERKNLPALMDCFEEITTSAKKINSLTRNKSKKNSNGNKNKKKSSPDKVKAAAKTEKSAVAKKTPEVEKEAKAVKS